jgi:hypothetical protein
MIRRIAVGSAGGAEATRASRLAWFPPADPAATIRTARCFPGRISAAPAADTRRDLVVGEIVDFESTFLLCYDCRPEGLIVELAERLEGTSDWTT